jgi:hypothetical protein
MTKLLQSAVRNFGAGAAGLAILFGSMTAVSCNKELKMVKPGKKRNTAKALAAAGLIGMATAIIAPALASCDNGTTPEFRQTVFPLNYGFTVEDQTGGLLNLIHIGIINEYLDIIYNTDSSNMDTLLAKV